MKFKSFIFVFIIILFVNQVSSQAVIGSNPTNGGGVIIAPPTSTSSGSGGAGNVSSVVGDSCVLINPTIGDVVVVFNTSCAGINQSYVDDNFARKNGDNLTNHYEINGTLSITSNNTGIDQPSLLNLTTTNSQNSNHFIDFNNDSVQIGQIVSAGNRLTTYSDFALEWKVQGFDFIRMLLNGWEIRTSTFINFNNKSGTTQFQINKDNVKVGNRLDLNNKNISNFFDNVCPTGFYAYGIWDNGTIQCRQESANSSWNQSYADTLYSDIVWGYNQSDPVLNYLNNNFLRNDSGNATGNYIINGSLDVGFKNNAASLVINQENGVDAFYFVPQYLGIYNLIAFNGLGLIGTADGAAYYTMSSGTGNIVFETIGSVLYNSGTSVTYNPQANFAGGAFSRFGSTAALAYSFFNNPQSGIYALHNNTIVIQTDGQAVLALNKSFVDFQSTNLTSVNIIQNSTTDFIRPVSHNHNCNQPGNGECVYDPWFDPTTSRAFNTIYTNNQNTTIDVKVTVLYTVETTSDTAYATAYTNKTTWRDVGYAGELVSGFSSQNRQYGEIHFFVDPGEKYEVNTTIVDAGAVSLTKWLESW